MQERVSGWGSASGDASGSETIDVVRALHRSDDDRHPDNMDGVWSRWSLRHEGAPVDACRDGRLSSTGRRVRGRATVGW